VTAVLHLLELRRGNVADRLEEAPVFEQVDSLEGGELDILDSSPRLARPDGLRLVQPDHRLVQGVVVRFAHGADRGFDVGLSQPLRGKRSSNGVLPAVCREG
jgi:hypothetical protein